MQIKLVVEWGSNRTIYLKNHRIQRLELNGTFLGKSGTKGSSLKELSYPSSAAVLITSNGRIVAFDNTGNNCI